MVYFRDVQGFNRIYGPFESDNIAIEYMGEIGLTDVVPLFTSDEPIAEARAPSADFLQMVFELGIR